MQKNPQIPLMHIKASKRRVPLRRPSSLGRHIGPGSEPCAVRLWRTQVIICLCKSPALGHRRHTDTIVDGSHHKFHSQTRDRTNIHGFHVPSHLVPSCNRTGPKLWKPNMMSLLQPKQVDKWSSYIMQMQPATNQRNCIFFQLWRAKAGTISASDSALSSETQRDGKDNSVSVSVSPRTSADLQYTWDNHINTAEYHMTYDRFLTLHKPQVILGAWQCRCCAPIRLSSASPVLAPWPGCDSSWTNPELNPNEKGKVEPNLPILPVFFFHWRSEIQEKRKEWHHRHSAHLNLGSCWWQFLRHSRFLLLKRMCHRVRPRPVKEPPRYCHYWLCRFVMLHESSI
jgi:hypothetical protein